MPRDPATGAYSLPGLPFVPGTPAYASQVNDKFSDVADALTLSLSRDGQGAMLAPLKLIGGSLMLPALTFTSEPTTGLYYPGANSMALGVASTLVQQWAPTGSTFSRPLVVNAGTVDSTAVTGTGTGTGAGGTFTGGATNGRGVQGTGTGNANGVRGTGGPNSGTGVEGVGGATNGVVVIGSGAGSGDGVTGTGGATNGRGVVGTGGGSGAGVRGVGGPSGGDGLIAIGGGSAGRGVNALGAPGQAGGLFTAGTAATAAVPQMAIRVAQGYVTFESTVSPASTTPIQNALTPANIVKAWATLQTNINGTVTILDGFNIASATTSNITNRMTVTFAQPFASANYTVVVSWQVSDGIVSPFSTTASSVEIRGRDFSSGSTPPQFIERPLNSTSNTIRLMCIGTQ